MTETFNWAPLNSPSGSTSFRLIEAQFGDGYLQVANDGINNKVQSWPLSFRGDRTKIEAIAAFLDRHAGSKSFLWTPPLGVEGYYRVKSYNPSSTDKLVHGLSATFEQVFFP